MVKVLVIYGTTVGNTERLAEKIVTELKSYEVETTLKNVTDANVGELSEYDVILLGSSTWGDGELQDDFADFYSKLEGMDFKGKKAAVFGPGDSSYDQFCKAVNILEECLKKCGAKLLLDGLKIDGEIDDSTELITEWSQQLATSILS
jgi:flavodoxin I